MAKMVVNDTPINKPVNLARAENRPMRLAGRPRKKNLLQQAPRSQLAFYNRLAQEGYEYIKELKLLSKSKNERIRIEALKIILDKLLPNAKNVDGGNKHSPVSVFINNQGFVPQDGDAYGSSGGSLKRPTPLQSLGVAQEGEENIDSNQRDGEAGSPEEGGLLAPISDLRGS